METGGLMPSSKPILSRIDQASHIYIYVFKIHFKIGSTSMPRPS